MAWPDAPEDLLAGPRGRRLCFELVSPRRADAPVRASPGWDALQFGRGKASPELLAAELGALVAAADLAGSAAAADETSLLAPMRSSVGAAMYWQPPDEVDQMLADTAVADVLGPVARAVTELSAAAWWRSPMTPGNQQFIQVLDREWPDARADGGPELSGAADRLAAWRAATVEDERGAAARPADPAAPYSGHWWSSPAANGLVTTTRALPRLPAVGLELVEDWAGWSEIACWQLEPEAQVRGYEIRGPQDWVTLVTRYPVDVSKSRRHDWWRVTGRAGAWVVPDFAAVAADYDAVHLTVGGYLTTAGRALATVAPGRNGKDGAVTMLAGWNPDTTYWLADVLSPASAPERWVNPDREPLDWKRAG
ncbi:MAG: hypothetical protein ACLQFR_25395 [Streptosporangiaceae bacterium]